jgi:hypothetical protein
MPLTTALMCSGICGTRGGLCSNCGLLSLATVGTHAGAIPQLRPTVRSRAGRHSILSECRVLGLRTDWSEAPIAHPVEAPQFLTDAAESLSLAMRELAAVQHQRAKNGDLMATVYRQWAILRRAHA